MYLLYGRNPDGEVGYYLYNPQDESLQRYAVMPARPTQPVLPEIEETAPVEEQPAEETATSMFSGEGVILPGPVFYGVCGLVAALVITIIAMAVSNAREKARRKRRAEQRRAERKKMLAEETAEEKA